jgi:hypothetical protein
MLVPPITDRLVCAILKVTVPESPLRVRFELTTPEVVPVIEPPLVIEVPAVVAMLTIVPVDGTVLLMILPVLSTARVDLSSVNLRIRDATGIGF